MPDSVNGQSNCGPPQFGQVRSPDLRDPDHARRESSQRWIIADVVVIIPARRASPRGRTPIEGTEVEVGLDEVGGVLEQRLAPDGTKAFDVVIAGVLVEITGPIPAGSVAPSS